MSLQDALERARNMSATKAPKGSTSGPPETARDGFHLIPRTHIVYDVDLTRDFQFTDVTYHKSTVDQCARIAFDRPEILHAFRPTTIRQIQTAFVDATEDPRIAVILITSTTSPTATPAFCAGGDQSVRIGPAGGYQDGTERGPAKLRVLDLQLQIRTCPKPVIAVVRGYAVGGGHILHMCCDLTLCSENAVLGQTGPRMGSFDAGYGCTQAVQLMGTKRAKELWFLCRYYTAREGLEMGMVNAVFADSELEAGTAQWVRRIAGNSPTALAACKAACHAPAHDGGVAIQSLGGQLTRLFYQSAEGQEGHRAYMERRAPQFRSNL